MNHSTNEQTNPLLVLDKLVSNPHGTELLALFANFWKEVKPPSDTTNRAEPAGWLIHKGISRANALGIQYPPYFKGMTDAAIQDWIDAHSLESADEDY